MTELIYLMDSQLFEVKANIISCGHDDKGAYIILDRTIFYPQGGGQPSDQGKIILNDNTVILIYDVRLVENKVYHYVYSLPEYNIDNREGTITIDVERRKVNSRYHTAGHLIASIIDKNYPNLQAIKGHQFPNEAYVECKGEWLLDNYEDLQYYINKSIIQNLVVISRDMNTQERKDATRLISGLPDGKKIRICKIGNYDAVPCGGTHVSSLCEIGHLNIIKITTKKEKTKISYEVR